MPVRSLSSPVLKWPDARQVDQAVRRWVAQVAESRPEITRVGYFGSYARGDWGADPKARPALIVSMDVRNRLANDVIVVPVSTTQRPAPTHVRLPAGEGGRGPFAGAISPALMQEVEKAIQRAIGIFLP